MPLFAITQKFWDNADCLTVAGEDCVCDRAHHAQMSAAKYKSHTVSGHKRAEVAGCFGKSGIVADRCAAEHAGGFHG
jgi:hypothetical protein